MKTTLKYIVLFAVIFISNDLFAQNIHFIKNGVIEFEKKSNIYAIIKKKINKDNESYMVPAFDQYKKNNPQFKVAKSILSFNSDKSLYKWPAVDETLNPSWAARDALVDLKNTIATDYTANTSISQKAVYEDTYLVKDSLRKINWKITDETREIAGYECRRANAIIMDSIYVVAYYSNQIAVSGGPESFTGLPGMILGLALPHQNITWFATKVTEVTVPEKDLTPPTKGKPIDNKGLTQKITSALKNYGPEALSELKAFTF
ncbi:MULTISPECIES: GLPGLI family protein [unclassified Pedobacter]|uniref:GLPGLI family protein n=1 Tax=unclassified Pedobacter TaxID=2628915 RepID=UPI0014204A22|nr:MULTISPECIES: GLPGLI family protein [unclassified Pedobacter]NII84151.1 GLPGLI family protein [Pedobacter sp. SG908]NMN38933.1 GLPGLI family protein [Pedobacter sp. SG918]